MRTINFYERNPALMEERCLTCIHSERKATEPPCNLCSKNCIPEQVVQRQESKEVKDGYRG